MISIRSGSLAWSIPALALVLSASGCGPSQAPSKAATPPRQALAPAVATQPAQAQAMQPQAAPVSPPQSPAQQQRIRNLIQQVDAAYAAGQADYKKGDLPAARRDFDHAVDLMLTSGLDIKSTPELQDEFDRIVDQINGLEMEALRQGNGFTPKTEDTPAEAAEEVTFVVDPNIVAKANADLATTKSDLPLVVNDYVAAYINFFANTTKGHNTLLHAFQRAGRYRQMIERVMSEEGVPHDLIYLAVAESGFQPRAVNRKSRAGGMWQFMPYGSYGLTRNIYVDERFDPEKSTRAYARYMKYIYEQLGDWYLSMAGYDWGTGNVQRAVQKTGYADFWELYKRNNLPGETKNYVPEILAAIIIANHPTQYGFDDITLDPPVLTDTVTINYSADLRLVSDIVGAPIDELIALNPSLLRMVTPPDTEFDLHLPAGTAALFQEKIAAIPVSKRDSWRYHKVTPDDTLASVARTYSVSVSALADANQLDTTSKLDGVEALVVPVPARAVPSSHTVYYTTRRGDTLVSIADRFGISLSQLRRWNKLPASGIRVDAGRRLHVAEPTVVRASATRTRRGSHAKTPSSRTSSHAAKSSSSKTTHKSTSTKRSTHPKTSTRAQK
ncbi:lytic transglycosylase domain-containing protein [Occallatibacter savannae]|uniref:lytic transglycosylase domain-containing protein n=1 Tax=Occallatibacter savannae TaxID=1002691 RepID=UPI001EF5A9F2|nr:lytic transglycosylase domain-containing protein [Occallatibacter savannae]